MKVAVLEDLGKLSISERDMPECERHDVLVKIEVCGVCRTDRKSFAIGQRDLQLPRILGHEIVGRVEKVGDSVTRLKPGDRVQVYPGIACGGCVACKSGNDHLCDEMQIIGFHSDGGFAEYMLVKGSFSKPSILNKIPDRLDSCWASLAEPVACSLNLLKRLDIRNADTVVIFGAGPLGLITAELLAIRCGAEIAIVEPHPSRRAIAANYSHAQFDFTDNISEQLLEFTNGNGADIIIPCCPGNAPFEIGLEIAAKRGRIGFFSGLTDTSNITNKALNTIHYRELSLIGAYGCSSRDVRQALGLLASDELNFSTLPALNITWDELPANIANLEPQDHIFTFFWPDITKAKIAGLSTFENLEIGGEDL